VAGAEEGVVAKRRVVLGALEQAVLDRLWEAGPSDVRAMHQAVGVPRGIAPNTVQSTLERLARKGLARRRKLGRAFQYTAAVSREQWVASAVHDLVAGLGPASLAAAFVDLAERAGVEELAELERLVRSRRRARREDA
jgi:predicted transcriptional regulator